MPRIMTIFMIIFTLGGCSLFESADRVRVKMEEENQRKWASLNIKDGIDSIEAQIIAYKYYDRYLSICGALGPIEETETEWRFRVVLGIAAVPYKAPIIINKKTGAVSLEGYPSFENPFDLNVASAIEGYTMTCP